MNTKITITRMDESACVILPQEVLDDLQVAVGDTLLLIRTEHGFELTRDDAAFREAMEGFEIVRREHRDAFRKLGR